MKNSKRVPRGMTTISSAEFDNLQLHWKHSAATVPVQNCTKCTVNFKDFYLARYNHIFKDIAQAGT